MSDDRARRKRFDRITFVVLVAAVLGSFVGPRRFVPPAAAPYASLALFTAIVVTVGMRLLRDRKSYRDLREVRVGGRWPLGEGYQVGLDVGGSGLRVASRLEIDEVALEFGVMDRFTIPVAGVDAIRVRPSWIEIEGAGRLVRIAPGSYADRERLLWELAVRCPDAMERGIDETPPRLPTQRAAASPLVDGSGSGASGLALGSALAGPMDRGNPAPPRKSGLGVGLFMPPPGSRTTED